MMPLTDVIRLAIKTAIEYILILLSLIGDLIKAWFFEIRKFFSIRPKSVTGAVVAITGGAGAIGKHVAKKLAERGAKIVLIDWNQEMVEIETNELIASGHTAAGFYCDCRKIDDMVEVAKKVEEYPGLGPVDILICCAGNLRAKSIIDLSEDDIRQSFEVNVISMFWAIKAFLPSMIDRNVGHVVAISSVAGHFGQSFSSAYSASKFAIRGLMEAVKWELEDMDKLGVKTTIIYPYFTQTPLLKDVEPSSRFFEVLPVDYTASEIVRNILYEKEEAFIPNIVGIFCLFIKQVSPGKVKAVWRKFFNVVYFTGTPIATPQKSQTSPASTINSPTVATIVETLLNGVDKEMNENGNENPKAETLDHEDAPKLKRRHQIDKKTLEPPSSYAEVVNGAHEHETPLLTF